MSEASDKTRTPHVGSADERVKSAGMRNLGIGLILLSGVCFFVMLSIPWMPLSVTQKAMLGGGLFVTVQVSWWVGAAITRSRSDQENLLMVFLEKAGRFGRAGFHRLNSCKRTACIVPCHESL